jgi:hypothetical protein
MYNTGAWVLADADGAAGTYPARGLITSAQSGANVCGVIVKGIVRNDAWNWTPGGPIYLSTTAGGLTQTPPAATTNKVQVVGWAISADEMFVDPNSEYLTIT